MLGFVFDLFGNMYMEEIFSEEIKNETFKLLKSFGVKHGLKKLDQRLCNEKQIELYHVFKTSLELLEKECVRLIQSSVPVTVPVFVIDCCEFIKQNIRIEGLFRKAGSTSKQRELRALLDCGNRLELGTSHNVINVANILKLFFRELPEPLIPFKYHDLLLRCLTLKENNKEAILLGCLLFPADHLNTLAYLMQFLQHIAKNSDYNKMDVGNLAIIFTPTIMPVSAPKLTPHGGQRINHHVQIIRILIENAELIGIVPESICEKLCINPTPTVCETDNIQKTKKKKRSGSLTRMISGFKKLIGKHSTDGIPNSPSISNIHTPKIMSAKKRKGEVVSISAKKKREVIKSLPQGLALANTLYTPLRNRTSGMLSPRIIVTQPSRLDSTMNVVESTFITPKEHSDNSIEKNMDKNQTLIQPEPGTSNIDQLLNPVESVDNLDIVETSSVSQWDACLANSLEASTEEYVKIPKTEFEAIKERVIKMENKIDNELERLLTISGLENITNSSTTLPDDNYVSNIQNAYFKTIEQSERLNSSSTERLTRKLNRELKIRLSSEQRIIRSPSARKIGTIRRRSKENVFSRRDLNRHFSLTACDTSSDTNKGNLYSSRSLRRGKPNTVYSGLRQPCTSNPQSNVNYDSTSSILNSDIKYMKLKSRPLSFQGRLHMKESFMKTSVEKDNPADCEKWTTDYDSLGNENDEATEENDRESIAKIRKENIGMVIAKAKLFDSLHLKDENLTVTSETCHATDNKKCELRQLIPTCRASHRSKSPKRKSNNLENVMYEKENDIALGISGSNPHSSIHAHKELQSSPLKDYNRNTPITQNVSRALSLRNPAKKYHKDCCVTSASHTTTNRRSPRLKNLPCTKKFILK